VTQVAYGADADLYDGRTGRFQVYRDRLVAALEARPGDVVLDVGCGTGLCFGGLRKAVGPGGRVVGIEESADMVRLARRRAARHGWTNVSVLHSTVGGAQIPIVAVRALFCTVHDILQSFESLRKVFDHLRPGAQVVAGGGKFAASWLFALNVQLRSMHGPYVRSFEGFERPWALLAPFLDDLRVTDVALGTGYCVVGQARHVIPGHPSGQPR